MLNALRLFSQSWLAKLLLFIVILCFALIWGSPLSRTIQTSSVISSGNSTVTSDELIFFLDKSLRTASLNLGKKEKMTYGEAQRLNLLTYLNQQLNRNVLLQEECEKLGLVISNKRISQLLADDSFFKYGGFFNKSLFKAYVRSLGVSESDVIKYYRDLGIRNQLISTIQQGLSLPNIFFTAMENYLNHKFDIEYMVVTLNNIVPVKPRSEEILRKWYDSHKSEYMTKEKRAVDLVYLSKEDLKKKLKISEKEISDYYDKNKTSYSIPEKRDFETLSYKTKSDAEQMLPKIKKSPAEYFKQNKTSNNSKEANTAKYIFSAKQEITKTSDNAAIFALSQDAISDPIKIGNEYIIARVTKITPQKQKSLTEVKGEIEKLLLENKANQEMKRVYKDIKQQIDNHLDLKTIAKKYGLTIESHVFNPDGEVADSDNKNSEISGDATENIKVNSLIHKGLSDKEWQKLVRYVFHMHPGPQSIDISRSNDHYIWGVLKYIDLGHRIAFDKVKKSIEEKFLRFDQDTALHFRTMELKKELDDGASFNEVANENNLIIHSMKGIANAFSTKKPEKDIDPMLLESIISHNAGDHFIYRPKNRNERYIITITKVYCDNKKDIKPSNYLKNSLNQNLKNSITERSARFEATSHPIIVKDMAIKRIMRSM